MEVPGGPQAYESGVDVHARSVIACGLDGATGELFERRLTPDHGELLAWLGGLPGPVEVVYEAGLTGFGLGPRVYRTWRVVSGRWAVAVAAPVGGRRCGAASGPAPLRPLEAARSALSYGGAKMPLPVIERALRVWPQVDFVNAYGLTETSSTVTVLGPDQHRAALAAEDEAGRARLASAGLPVPGIELEIRDGTGAVLPAGRSGEIWVRGDQVSGEYAGRGPMVDARGLFFTRDHGRLDEEGFLYVEGRMDDTIIRGAENIAPAEIEDVLLRHPDVLDAVVVGVPDEEWGQRIEAVVVARPGSGLDVEELRAACRVTLRSSKTPDRVVCWDELPRTVTGKLLRRDVVSGLAADVRSVAG